MTWMDGQTVELKRTRQRFHCREGYMWDRLSLYLVMPRNLPGHVSDADIDATIWAAWESDPPPFDCDR